MKGKTKKLPLIEKCEDCVFCIAEYLHTCYGSHIAYRCKHPDIKYNMGSSRDPLKQLEEDGFPVWCPLENGDDKNE